MLLLSSRLPAPPWARSIVSRLPAPCCCPCRCFRSESPPPPPSAPPSCNLLLNRQWMLASPAAPIHVVSFPRTPRGQESPGGSFAIDTNPSPSSTVALSSSSFYLVRDDLLHPLVNGNKARKLDALIPVLRQHAVTDLVTCGGCQSAHAAAVAVCCAERGIRPHLLLRGEQPEVPTGYNLVSLTYGDVRYVPRSEYAQREEMLRKHADAVAGAEGGVIAWMDDLARKGSGAWMLEDASVEQDETETGLRRVAIVNEGAGGILGLLGLIRLVKYLSEVHVFGNMQNLHLVLDAGTGTTAIGLALGALYLGLQWKITAVMLADTVEKYREREKYLISEFKRIYQLEFSTSPVNTTGEFIVHWVDRQNSRRFGKVLGGEIDSCRQIARQTGVLLDPVYTLAAWEHAIHLVEEDSDTKVVMIHTGGTLGMFGLAQRYTSDFKFAAGSSL